MSNEAGVKKVKLRTSPFIIEKLLQIVAAKSASREVDESLSTHVSQEERNRRPTIPTTHENRGNASVNAQGSFIS
jgi:hypothetical protein